MPSPTPKIAIAAKDKTGALLPSFCSATSRSMSAGVVGRPTVTLQSMVLALQGVCTEPGLFYNLDGQAWVSEAIGTVYLGPKAGLSTDTFGNMIGIGNWHRGCKLDGLFLGILGTGCVEVKVYQVKTGRSSERLACDLCELSTDVETVIDLSAYVQNAGMGVIWFELRNLSEDEIATVTAARFLTCGEVGQGFKLGLCMAQSEAEAPQDRLIQTRLNAWCAGPGNAAGARLLRYDAGTAPMEQLLDAKAKGFSHVVLMDPATIVASEILSRTLAFLALSCDATIALGAAVLDPSTKWLMGANGMAADSGGKASPHYQGLDLRDRMQVVRMECELAKKDTEILLFQPEFLGLALAGLSADARVKNFDRWLRGRGIKLQHLTGLFVNREVVAEGIVEEDGPSAGELEVVDLAGAMDEVNPLRDASLRQASYYSRQARAIHRIFRILHPDARFKYLLKALDGFVGAPEAVVIDRREATKDGNPVERFERWETVGDNLDETFLGIYELGAASDRASRVVVVACIPRQPVGDLVHGVRTSPHFDKAIFNWVLWASPVILEHAKFVYEQRQIRECSTKHSFKALPRPLLQRFGNLPDLRNRAKRPSILIGFHWLEMGGAEKLAFDSVKWARSAGFRVLILSERPEAQRMASKLPDDPEVEFIRVDAYLPGGLWGAFIEELVKSENVLVVHIHHCTRLYDNLLKLKTFFPEIVVIDSTHIIELSDGGFPRTSGVWTKYIDFHHVISRELVGFYLNNFGVAGKVKLGRMLDTAKTRAALVDPVFNLTHGKKTCRVAFVGRMVHQKRAPLFVAIAQKLIKWAKGREIRFHFDMVGTGAYLDVVNGMIERAGLRHVFTLHPPDMDVAATLSKSDILILPSSNEGLALVCYEAIENGVIPISTDVGGQNELIPDSLMLSTSPIKCVREATSLVVRLLSEPAFLTSSKSDLIARYRDLRQDPTAEETLKSIYSNVLSLYRSSLYGAPQK